MFVENKTIYLRREIIARIVRLYFENKLIEEIDKLPVKMIKKNALPFRCCVYKDREIIKCRTIASLGFSLENEFEIDTNLLSHYAKLSLERDKPKFPILTFINEACKACVKTNYFVTNVCKNCVAKPCVVNCPKDAINTSINMNQAIIDHEKCVNCGLCMKVCPFHAIVYVPVPCEESCPVDAIVKDEKGGKSIDYTKCIFCGKCKNACPFGAVMEKSHVIDIIKHINSDRKVIAMIAPSIIGQFPADLMSIIFGLKKFGFDFVVEVAVGADKTAKIEAEEFIERMNNNQKLMGTSCCPAYIEAVKKHAKLFEPFVSDAKTPMAYTAEIVKAEYPDAVRVFIGPCIAKKHEGLANDDIDYVLTYEELGAMFMGKDINLFEISKTIEGEKAGSSINPNIEKETQNDLFNPTNIGRSFPVTGGVANAVKDSLKETDRNNIEFKPVFIDGFTKKNVKLLNIYAQGKCPGNLLEVMSCEGGCIAGPGVISKPQVVSKKLKEFLTNSQS